MLVAYGLPYALVRASMHYSGSGCVLQPCRHSIGSVAKSQSASVTSTGLKILPPVYFGHHGDEGQGLPDAAGSASFPGSRLPFKGAHLLLG